MKQIVCEMCDGTDFLKEDGLFVCRECGMKYSPQDAKRLLREMDGTPAQPVQYAQPAQPVQPVQYAQPAQPAQPVQPVQYAQPVQPVQPVQPAKPAPVQQSEKPKTVATQQKQDEKKKKSVGTIVGRMGVMIFGLLFVVGLLMSILSIEEVNDVIAPEMAGSIGDFIVGLRGGQTGNLLLLIDGIVALLVATILWKIIDYRQKMICPCCATKRVHHRDWLRTTEKDQTVGAGANQFDVTTYTHHYRDTYVCPKCGETLTVQTQGNGGQYKEFMNGTVSDTRRAPKEF